MSRAYHTIIFTRSYTKLDHQLSLDAASYARTIARRLVVRHADSKSTWPRRKYIFTLQSFHSRSVGLWGRERVVSGIFCFLPWCLFSEISWSMRHTKQFLNLVFNSHWSCLLQNYDICCPWFCSKHEFSRPCAVCLFADKSDAFANISPTLIDHNLASLHSELGWRSRPRSKKKKQLLLIGHLFLANFLSEVVNWQPENWETCFCRSAQSFTAEIWGWIYTKYSPWYIWSCCQGHVEVFLQVHMTS